MAQSVAEVDGAMAPDGVSRWTKSCVLQPVCECTWCESKPEFENSHCLMGKDNAALCNVPWNHWSKINFYFSQFMLFCGCLQKQ